MNALFPPPKYEPKPLRQYQSDAIDDLRVWTIVEAKTGSVPRSPRALSAAFQSTQAAR